VGEQIIDDSIRIKLLQKVISEFHFQEELSKKLQRNNLSNELTGAMVHSMVHFRFGAVDWFHKPAVSISSSPFFDEGTSLLIEALNSSSSAPTVAIVLRSDRMGACL
jgi:hypothetical protein